MATKPEWPTHPNGKPKRMGEMTRDEQEAQLKHICADLQREFEGPDSPFRKLFTEESR